MNVGEAHTRDGGRDGGFDGAAVYRDFELGKRAVPFEAAPLVILNSGQDQQRAEELIEYEAGHGLFTASLLETLREYEKAKLPVVVDDQLTASLAQRMQQLARTHGNRQTNQQPLRCGVDIRLFGVDEVQAQEMAGSAAL
jgi:hypothetical protein